MRRVISTYHLKEGFIVAIIFPVLFFISDSNSSQLITRFISTFFIIITFWLMNFALLDFRSLRFRDPKRKPLAFYQMIILSFTLSIAIYLCIGAILNGSGQFLSPERGNWGNSFRSWFFLCLQIFLFNALILLIKYAYDSNDEKRQIALENEILKRENLNAIHETLKQQVNPHFLFNSLTTLKSLTKHNPELAVQFIGELASVYRYMLAHQDKSIVTLGEELDFMKSYLYLLKLRFGDAICTDMQVPDAVLNYAMPPNTLQLLVENSVKHNSISLKKPLYISIYVQGEYLAVQNNLQAKPDETGSSQIGLTNIKSRYLLLTGKDIIIDKTANKFLVLLPLTLTA